METLDLYKDRRPYSIVLEVKGGKKTFKIPTELTVEESERLLETEIRSNALYKEEAGEGKEAEQQIKRYFDNLLEYIIILLEHYQPEITMGKLRKMISQAEAIRIFEFFKKQRFIHIMGLDKTSEDDESKKKLKLPKQD